MTPKWTRCICAAAVFAVIMPLSTVDPVSAEIRPSDLNLIRSVREGEWLQMKLAVLGLRLSYPAYRIELGLDHDDVVEFNFWISAPLAQHLEDAGRGELARALSYHAGGIRDQVMVLLRDDFPELWPLFDVQRDFGGAFLVPGEEFDSLPRHLGQWRDDNLILQ